MGIPLHFFFRPHISFLADQYKSPNPHVRYNSSIMFSTCLLLAPLIQKIQYIFYILLTIQSKYLTFLSKLPPIQYICLLNQSTSVYFVYTCQSTCLLIDARTIVHMHLLADLLEVARPRGSHSSPLPSRILPAPFYLECIHPYLIIGEYRNG